MKRQHGFALVTVLTLLVVLMALVTAYFFLTNIELSTTTSQANSTSGFYSAEAALNLRGEAIRKTFVGFNTPQGVSPSSAAPCQNSDNGSGTFACETTTLNSRKVTSYVVEDPRNKGEGKPTRIPDTEPFGGLNAFESRYDVVSTAKNPSDDTTEAQLEMVFRSRLVPVFQFAAFYNKDLEIAPGANMTLNGRVHANGDLYLNSSTGTSLGITGQVTVAKRPDSSATGLYRGRKNVNSCEGVVTVDDLNPATSSSDSPERIDCSGLIPQTRLDKWKGQIQTGLDTLVVPDLLTFTPGGQYWQQADLRVVLNLFTNAVEVRVPDGTSNGRLDTTLTNRLNNDCTSANPDIKSLRVDPSNPNGYAPPAFKKSTDTTTAVERSSTFFNTRENKAVTILEVDAQALLDCMHRYRNDFLGISGDINDTSGGGLVWYFSVLGPDSQKTNNYGVRVRNGARLRSNIAGAPAVKGLTIVSDQAVYTQGNYNCNSASCSGTATDNWRPASFIADSLNVLSEGWDVPATQDANRADVNVNTTNNDGSRVAETTELNAAFLAGTDATGDKEGSAGRNLNNYNGGLENYPRFHENWNQKTLTYRGSFVSFGKPQHVIGRWEKQHYKPPVRTWSYDTRFDNATMLPPLGPRFVYLRQEIFMRDFEQ